MSQIYCKPNYLKIEGKQLEQDEIFEFGTDEENWIHWLVMRKVTEEDVGKKLSLVMDEKFKKSNIPAEDTSKKESKWKRNAHGYWNQ